MIHLIEFLHNNFKDISITVSSQYKKRLNTPWAPTTNESDNKKSIFIGNPYEIMSEISKNHSTTRIFLGIKESYPSPDLRILNDIFLLPIFEPSTSEELILMLYFTIKFSEITPLSSIIIIPEKIDTINFSHSLNYENWINEIVQYLPDYKNFYTLNFTSRIKLLNELSNILPFNEFNSVADHSLGIIACGEVCNEIEHIRNFPYSLLKIKQYPVSVQQVESIFYSCDELLILENGIPYFEMRLRGILGIGMRTRGKLNHIVPENTKINREILSFILNFPLT